MTRVAGIAGIDHVFNQQRSHRGKGGLCLVVIDCSSSPTADTIWSLIVFASV